MKPRAFEAQIIAGSCSSQEEHVLKLLQRCCHSVSKQLLLARGACIETNLFDQAWKISKELLLARGACIETLNRCITLQMTVGCSSQEEHVLKLFRPEQTFRLRRVAPRKRSMY